MEVSFKMVLCLVHRWGMWVMETRWQALCSFTQNGKSRALHSDNTDQCLYHRYHHYIHLARPKVHQCFHSLVSYTGKLRKNVHPIFLLFVTQQKEFRTIPFNTLALGSSNFYFHWSCIGSYFWCYSLNPPHFVRVCKRLIVKVYCFKISYKACGRHVAPRKQVGCDSALAGREGRGWSSAVGVGLQPRPLQLFLTLSRNCKSSPCYSYCRS